jgi:hypothetical protein
MWKPVSTTVFALKAWTIKRRGDKFYIGRSASFDDKRRWINTSYGSLQAACMAIARKHAEEWRARSERQKVGRRPSKEDGR